MWAQFKESFSRFLKRLENQIELTELHFVLGIYGRLIEKGLSPILGASCLFFPGKN